MHLFLISGCRDFRSRSLLQWSENDVCDWVDELGGIFDEKGSVIEYIKYIVTTTVLTVQGTPAKEEKKKSNKAKLG